MSECEGISLEPADSCGQASQGTLTYLHSKLVEYHCLVILFQKYIGVNPGGLGVVTPRF